MTQPPENAGSGIVSILSVSPRAEDHVSLAHILDQSNWRETQNLKFNVNTSHVAIGASGAARESNSNRRL